MLSLSRFWYEFRQILPWLLIPFIFWLSTYGLSEMAPLIIVQPRLRELQSETIALPVISTQQTFTSTVNSLPSDYITATVTFAFPTYLPYSNDISAPLMLMVQSTQTHILDDDYAHLAVKINDAPLIVLDDSGEKISSPFFIPINDQPTLYYVPGPFKSSTYTMSISSPLFTNSGQVDGIYSNDICSMNIPVKGVFASWLFRTARLLGSVVPLPLLISSLFGYVAKIRKDWEVEVSEREDLQLSNEKIVNCIRVKDYQQAFEIYEVNLNKYKRIIKKLKLNEGEVEKLEPILYIDKDEFKRFLIYWFWDKSKLSGQTKQESRDKISSEAEDVKLAQDSEPMGADPSAQTPQKSEDEILSEVEDVKSAQDRSESIGADPNAQTAQESKERDEIQSTDGDLRSNALASEKLKGLFWARQHIEVDGIDSHIVDILKEENAIQEVLEVFKDIEPLHKEFINFIKERSEDDNEFTKWVDNNEDLKQRRDIQELLHHPTNSPFSDLGIYIERDFLDLEFEEYFYMDEQVFDLSAFSKGCHTLVTGESGSGKTVFAFNALKELLDPSEGSGSQKDVYTPNREVVKGSVKMFPCYTQEIPKSDQINDFINWVYAAIANQVLLYLMRHPSCWTSTSREKRSSMAWVIRNTYSLDQINARLSTLPKCKRLYDYLVDFYQNVGSGLDQKSSNFNFLLSMAGNACPTPWDGIALIVDPLSATQSLADYCCIISNVFSNLKILSVNKIFIKIFSLPINPELSHNWSGDMLEIGWKSKSLFEMLKTRIVNADVKKHLELDLRERFSDSKLKIFAGAVSTPYQMLCLAKKWLRMDWGEMDSSEENLKSWAEREKDSC